MITIKNLRKSFSGLEVLKGIDLEIQKGEVIAVIGPSGSGKSTLLRCLNFLETPDTGLIECGDLSINAEAAGKQDIARLRKMTAMVFQHYNLFKNKTAIENIMEPLIVVKKMPAQNARRIAADILAQVGLADKQDAYPSKLSGGQQQRVGIGRALALKPELMLFDEPTSALDPELVGEVLEVIQNLAVKDTTMIIVTHEMKFAREAADRVIFMDEGKIVEQGTAEALFRQPQNPRTIKFLQKVNAY